MQLQEVQAQIPYGYIHTVQQFRTPLPNRQTVCNNPEFHTCGLIMGTKGFASPEIRPNLHHSSEKWNACLFLTKPKLCQYWVLPALPSPVRYCMIKINNMRAKDCYDNTTSHKDAKKLKSLGQGKEEHRPHLNQTANTNLFTKQYNCPTVETLSLLLF